MAVSEVDGGFTEVLDQIAAAELDTAKPADTVVKENTPSVPEGDQNIQTMGDPKALETPMTNLFEPGAVSESKAETEFFSTPISLNPSPENNPTASKEQIDSLIAESGIFNQVPATAPAVASTIAS